MPAASFALLLIALSTVALFAGDRGALYRLGHHDNLTAHHLAIAANLSFKDGLLRFDRRTLDADGAPSYDPYGRFGLLAYALIGLAIAPFDHGAEQIHAARILMLLFFGAAAITAYLSLCRLLAGEAGRPDGSHRWIALCATLTAFSSWYLLLYADAVSPEVIPDLFGMILTFHGLVAFAQEERLRPPYWSYWRLSCKLLVALLIGGWHVYGLLAPFVALGMAKAGRIALERRRARDDAPATTAAGGTLEPLGMARVAAAAMLRSRHLAVAAGALFIGSTVLGLTFAQEHFALGAKAAPSELPLLDSMLRRTLFGEFTGDGQSWRELAGLYASNLPLEIARIGQTSLPAAVPLSSTAAMAAGVTALCVCLFAIWRAKQKILLAALSLAGLAWSLLAPGYVGPHGFLAIFHVGIPLVLFAVGGLALTRRFGAKRLVWLPACAMLAFAASSWQVSRLGTPAGAALHREVMADMASVRRILQDKVVLVLPSPGDRTLRCGVVWCKLDYYLQGATILYRVDRNRDLADFILSTERRAGAGLLTPDNRLVHLYDRAAWSAAEYAKLDDLLASAGEPLMRADFDFRIHDNRLIYVKDRCRREDIAHRFLLHVYPRDAADLPPARREFGFENRDFWANTIGLRDGPCGAVAALPAYPMERLRTGQYVGTSEESGEVVWMAELSANAEERQRRYRRIREFIASGDAGEPVVRANFEVYRRGAELIYFKEPCGGADTLARFVLHVEPVDEEDLPPDARQRGFDNLSFRFWERGTIVDGQCLASVELPPYPVKRARTGQWSASEGDIWEAEFAP